MKLGLRRFESTGGRIHAAVRRRRSRPGLAGLGHGHQRRAQHAVVDQVTLLEHRRRRCWAPGRSRPPASPAADGDRTSGPRDRSPRSCARERGGQALQRQLDARAQRLGGHRRPGDQGLLQRVLDGQQVAGEFLDRVLVRLGDVVLAPGLRTFSVSARARSQASFISAASSSAFAQRIPGCPVGWAVACGIGGSSAVRRGLEVGCGVRAGRVVSGHWRFVAMCDVS